MHGRFAAQRLDDDGTGLPIVRLLYHHPREGGRSLEARVAPLAGSNLYSLKVGDDELLLQPPTLAELSEQRAGTPIMFPTPNRVRDARMVFEGRGFSFEANNAGNFIHGLARRRPWQVAALGATPTRAFVETALEWDPGQPEWERFPIAHRLSVTFTLRRDSVRIGYRVDNRDRQRLPFGFGLHPYFRIPDDGDRTKVFLQVPLTRRMEAVEMLPTGKLLPVAGTAHDLRRPTALSGLALDDVYFGMTPEKKARFELRSRGITVQLSGTEDFTHLVVFTPPERGFFCLENQTSSTDAHNLADRGLRRAAHLLVVPPAKRSIGHVDWKISLAGREK